MKEKTFYALIVEVVLYPNRERDTTVIGVFDDIKKGFDEMEKYNKATDESLFLAGPFKLNKIMPEADAWYEEACD